MARRQIRQGWSSLSCRLPPWLFQQRCAASDAQDDSDKRIGSLPKPIKPAKGKKKKPSVQRRQVRGP